MRAKVLLDMRSRSEHDEGPTGTYTSAHTTPSIGDQTAAVVVLHETQDEKKENEQRDSKNITEKSGSKASDKRE